MWCYWHLPHLIPMASPLVPLHFKMIIMRCNMTFLVMWCHWHQLLHHMMPMTSSMTPFNAFGQDKWNMVQHEFLVMWYHWCWYQHHVMLISMVPLHSLSLETDIRCHMTFLMWCNWHWHQHHMTPMAPLQSLDQDNWNEVQHEISDHVMPLAPALVSNDACSITTDTVAFLTSRQSKWGQT